MADKTQSSDFFDSEIKKYREKYSSVAEQTDDSDFVDELFESSDGTLVKDWSMDDIDRLISEVESMPDIEEAGEDFNFDRYEKYSEPESPSFGEIEPEEEEEVFDESAVYFSSKYKDDLISKQEPQEPFEFEDFSSVSEESKDEDNFFNDSDDDVFSSVEGNINEARSDGEFRAIDQTLDIDGSEQTEVVYDGTFDRGDYLKIKDIFKNSKILSKRRAERAGVRETALETVKEKYGEAIFDAKKREDDFNDILRRQKTVQDEKERQDKTVREKKFDVDSEDYVVTAKPQPEEIPVKEDKELDDTIFIKELSDFEEIAKSNATPDEDFVETRLIGDMPQQQNTRNIYITPQHRRADDDQIRFEGFPEDEYELTPEEINDNEIQESLRRTREEKKNLFRMTSLPDDYNDLDPNYFSPEK